MRSSWIAVSVVLVAGACAPVYVADGPGHEASGTARDRGSARVVPAASRTMPATAPSSSDAAALTPDTRELAAVLGTLVWPLAVDRATVLSSPYGVRTHPADGDLRFHAGLDLRAREGTPVYAAADGRVIRSGTGGAYGNLVIVDHGAGLASLYGHHSENLVAEGDQVRRGQVIALVGHTGNATGDHLHFELRWRGGTVDPKVVLPRLGVPALAR